MKDILINLIRSKPKHYTRLIKSNPVLLEWINSNSKIASDSIPKLVYSALYGTTDICQYGNKKNFVNVNEGFSGCGPAATCKCTRENISKLVTETKSAFTSEKRSQINSKRDQTMIARYGVAYNSQREDIHHIWSKPKIPLDVFSKLNDSTWLDIEYNQNNRSAVDIANELNVYYSTVIEYCIKHGFTIKQRSNYSIIEKDICAWLTSQGIDYEHNNWQIIGKELDIYIPSKNLAIEVDGLYWHSWHPNSARTEDRLRHLTKTKLAAEKGIELLHITDFEWTNKKNIITAILSSKLGLNERIFARQCSVRDVPAAVEKSFLNSYHLQGYIPSKRAVGLYYDDNLISLMTVGNSRFSKLAQHELLRYCTTPNMTVVGGGSRLLKNILDTTQMLVTYCDLSKSSGNGYSAMGFKHVRDTNPGYFWTDGNNVISRFKAQRSQMKRWLPSYDAKLSESENMFNAKYRRFNDCGNRVFVISK